MSTLGDLAFVVVFFAGVFVGALGLFGVAMTISVCRRER